MSKKAIVALTEHLGDLVATEPIARHVKSLGYHVTWLVNERYRELVAGNPNIDCVRTVTCLSEWEAIPYEREYHLVVDLHFDQRVCHKTRKPVARRVKGGPVTLENYYDRASLLAAFCAAGGLPELGDAPRLWLPEGPAPIDRPYVVLHCSSNEPEREWRECAWKMLAYDLAHEGVTAIEVGGQRVLDGVRGVVDMTGVLSFARLADILRHAHLFVGCDSGPAHMIDALSTDAVIPLGRYRHWKNYNPFTGSLLVNRADRIAHTGQTLQELPYPLVRAMVLGKLANKRFTALK